MEQHILHWQLGTGGTGKAVAEGGIPSDGQKTPVRCCEREVQGRHRVEGERTDNLRSREVGCRGKFSKNDSSGR